MNVLRHQYRFPFNQYPAVRLALLLIAGILLAKVMPAGSPTAFAVCAGGLLLTAALHIWSRRHPSVEWSHAAMVAYLFFVVLLGFSRSSIHEAQKNYPAEQRLAMLFEDEPLHWYGRLDEHRLSSRNTLALYFSVDSVKTTDGLRLHSQDFRTQIRYFRVDSAAAIPPDGSYLQLTAKPSPIPVRRNPHDFDVAGWLGSMDIYVQAIGGDTDQIIVLRQADPWHWSWWRARLHAGIENVFSEEQAPLAKAIMLGYKAGLDPELRQDFSRAGLAHLMAVSGMHVGFVLFPLWLLIPLFWRFRYGRAAGLLVIIGVLMMYAGITGFSASVQRASVFAFFIAFARLYQHRRDPLNLTGLAAFLMLLADPQALFHIGFQMSFAAVITIFVMLPLLERLFAPQKRNHWYARLVQLTLLSVCIQAALFPVLIHRFNEFSLIGPVMNTIAAPLTQLMFLAGFGAVFISMVHEAAGALAGIPADMLASGLSYLTEFSARIPGAFLQARLPSLWIYPLWASLFGFTATLLNPSLRIKWFILCLLIGLGWQSSQLIEKLQPPALDLTFFDVGQGDAVLVQTPYGKNYLYDAGVWTPYSNSGTRVLIPHLKAEGITHLDGVFLSHPHADHIGGLLSLIEDPDISIGHIYDSGFEVQAAVFSGYRVAAREHHIPVEVPQPGDIVWLDKATPAFILGPLPGLSSSNPNEHSLILQIHYGQQQVLLTGDAEKQAEELLLRHYGPLLESEIYKAGHHGSRSSSIRDFIEAVQPEKVVVSNGLNNRYGHPHPEAMARLHAYSGRVRYTALEGAIQISVTPESFEYRPWRDRPPIIETELRALRRLMPPAE